LVSKQLDFIQKHLLIEIINLIDHVNDILPEVGDFAEHEGAAVIAIVPAEHRIEEALDLTIDEQSGRSEEVIIDGVEEDL